MSNRAVNDIFYQYSHFFLTFYSVFLNFFSIISLILGIWLGSIVNYYYFFLVLLFLTIFPYGLDMFSRAVYNYPLFIMFFSKSSNWKNRFFIFLYQYVKLCFFLNGFILFMLCIFELLTLGHFIIFYEIALDLKICGMTGLLTIIQSPVMFEIFYYGWGNRSLYVNYESNENLIK